MKKATQSDSNAIYDKNVTHLNPNKRVDHIQFTLGWDLIWHKIWSGVKKSSGKAKIGRWIDAANPIPSWELGGKKGNRVLKKAETTIPSVSLATN